jgi:signal transduction histidine kinase
MRYQTETHDLINTLDSMITPMMLTNNVGTPLYVNCAFQEQIGYDITNLTDEDSWFEKAYPDTRYRKNIIDRWEEASVSRLKNGDIAINLITRICCVDGGYKWFDIYRHRIGTNYAITFLNVDGLKQQHDDVIDKVRQKDNLLAIMAHDVRSPLTSIKQMVDGYEHLNLSDGDIEELFFRMNNQIDYIFDILNSVLIHNGDERGRFVEKREHINLKSFFKKYLGYYKERLSTQNINLILELPDDALLNYDPGILDIICRNLVDNAIKYTETNGVISISYKKAANQASLLIRDTGPGMSNEQIEQIITGKGRNNSYREFNDGFGLGLMLAKEILEKHHGSLSIKSERGIGTSFTININEYSLI